MIEEKLKIFSIDFKSINILEVQSYISHNFH